MKGFTDNFSERTETDKTFEDFCQLGGNIEDEIRFSSEDVCRLSSTGSKLKTHIFIAGFNGVIFPLSP